ncbi:MAG TPA: aminoacyl-tRNA hydrolase [Candidatus Dormibacteraeota bacterium]
MAQLVIGLGNPGGEYAHTRHNVGWRGLDELERRGRFSRWRREGQARVKEGSIEGYDLVLARPQTYMNLSGRAGVQLVRRHGVTPGDVVVVHDEIDLPLGQVRLKRGGGHAGNRGVQSLIESWQTKDFIRVRIGVGRPPPWSDATDHVLDGFTPEERPLIDEAVVRAADAVMLVVTVGLADAMNDVNRRAP